MPLWRTGPIGQEVERRERKTESAEEKRGSFISQRGASRS